MTDKATYKIYSFADPTYTDISNLIVGDVKYTRSKVNNDLSPVFDGAGLQSVSDLSESSLASTNAILITYNTGTEVVHWIGYVISAWYEYDSKLWNYDLAHIFNKLQEYTTTDLFDTLFADTTYKTSRESSVKHDATDIDWYDVQLRGIFEQIFASDWFNGLTFALDYTTNCTDNMEDVLETNCISDLNLRYLGTDYGDEEIVDGTEDLVNCYDLLRQLLKDLGIKIAFDYTYSGSATIYLHNSDAKTGNQFSAFTTKDINRYKKDTRKLAEQKSVVLKQSMLTIQDNIDPENIHYYFSPLMFGIPLQAISNITQSGTNAQIDLPYNHLIPASNNTQIRDLKILSVITGDYSVDNGDWDYTDANSIDLIDTIVEEVRYLITNLGADVGTIEACYIIHTSGIAYSTGSITLTGHGLTNEDIIISDCYDLYMNLFVAGTYTYEAGTGIPSVGKYRIQNANEITVKKYVSPSTPQVSTNRTNDGFIRITTGSTGTAKYIISITEKTDYNPAGTGNTTVKVITATHGITGGAGDTLHINNTGLDDYDGQSWIEDNTATDLEIGEYRVIDANTLYLYDDGEPDLDPANLKFMFPQLNHEVTLQTAGKEKQTINLMEYLVIYRPSYSTDGDWKQDWWTIDFEGTVYNLLMNVNTITTPLHDFWNLYQFQSYYAEIIARTMNLDDDPTTPPSILACKSIIHNIDDNSIDIIQDDTV